MKKLVVTFMMLVMIVCVQAQELKIGDILPNFELTSSVYGNVKAADLKGKVILISLFATWCGPCQKELADVQSMLWPRYKDDKNFVMLVVGREHTDEQLQKYDERKGFTFPLYPDPKREVFSLFAEKTIPRAYLFGKDGTLIYSSIGYTAEEFQNLINSIEAALK